MIDLEKCEAEFERIRLVLDRLTDRIYHLELVVHPHPDDAEPTCNPVPPNSVRDGVWMERAKYDAIVAEAKSRDARIAELQAKLAVAGPGFYDALSKKAAWFERDRDRWRAEAQRDGPLLDAANKRIAELERERDNWIEDSNGHFASLEAAEKRIAALEAYVRECAGMHGKWSVALRYSRIGAVDHLLSRAAGLLEADKPKGGV